MPTTTRSPTRQRRLPLGWGPRRLRYPRSAAALAYVVGTPATAVGAGIAVRHLTTTGLTGTSAVGLVLLIAGLALLIFAGAVLWRGTHRWQRLWFVPVVVLTLLLMSSVMIGAMLAVAPRHDLGPATPADRGLAYRNAAFTTDDGVRLSGWYLPSANRAALVVVPGSGSTRSSTLDQAVVLARHGYGVLMLDPRGQGRSSGHAMDAGWYGERDVPAAVSYLQRQPDVDAHRIGVLGLSMGGEEAIGAAAVDPAIRVVVAEGATHRTAADKAGFLPGGLAGSIQRVLDKVTYGTAALLSSAPVPGTLRSAVIHASWTRFLLIAAGNGVDETDAAANLRIAAPNRVQTWTVPGAAHVQGLATAPGEWTARVIGFLNRTLVEANGTRASR